MQATIGREGGRCYGGLATVRLMDLSTLVFMYRVCNRAPGWCHRVGFPDQLLGPDGRNWSETPVDGILK